MEIDIIQIFKIKPQDIQNCVIIEITSEIIFHTDEILFSKSN